jgi:hypothetical protein
LKPTKLNLEHFKTKGLTQVEFEVFLVHSNQTQVWSELFLGYHPKGKLKESLISTKNELSRLNAQLPVSEELFDTAVEISDSLLSIMMLPLEQQQIIINNLKKMIDDIQQ